MSRIALALGGGFLVAVSLPPWGWWPLAVVGVVVFELALGPAPSRGERFWRGFAFGFGWLAMGVGWMWQLTVPGYIAASILFAALHGVGALAAPTGRWRIIGRPAAQTLVEALRFSFPFGGVPLASLGISQVAGPLAGVVRVGGVILLTWVVFQLGFAIGALVGAPGPDRHRGRRRSPARAAPRRRRAPRIGHGRPARRRSRAGRWGARDVVARRPHRAR